MVGRSYGHLALPSEAVRPRPVSDDSGTCHRPTALWTTLVMGLTWVIHRKNRNIEFRVTVDAMTNNSEPSRTIASEPTDAKTAEVGSRDSEAPCPASGPAGAVGAGPAGEAPADPGTAARTAPPAPTRPRTPDLAATTPPPGGTVPPADPADLPDSMSPSRTDETPPPLPGDATTRTADHALPQPGEHGAEPRAQATPHPLDGPFAPAEQIVLRSPAELVDALPYLLGYRPEDSIVLVAVHDRHGHGSFGGRAHLGIPECPEDWPAVARQLARALVSGCERRGAKPEGMVAFVCRDPSDKGAGRQVMEELRPLAQLLRTACGSLDVPVLEALCISDGRFWSYCCPGTQCCPSDGTPMGLPGSSVFSAAMTYAGFQVRGTLREFRARLSPWETGAALDQQKALDSAGMNLVPRMLDEGRHAEVATDTIDLARRLMKRLACAPRVVGSLEADQRDDELIGHDEAAALIFGLQDRTTRDRVAQWMEGDEAGPALRLWRSLARRCVGPYGEYAAAPLTLAGWVAWSTGDELEAREALAMALGANPDYVLARLLHQACNEGVSPEVIRRCLRTSPEDAAASGARSGVDGTGVPTSDPGAPAALVDGTPAEAATATARSTPAPVRRTAGTDDPAPRSGSAPERRRRAGSRSAARRGPRPTRPGGTSTAAKGPGPSRPPHRRTTGRG